MLQASTIWRASKGCSFWEYNFLHVSSAANRNGEPWVQTDCTQPQTLHPMSLLHAAAQAVSVKSIWISPGGTCHRHRLEDTCAGHTYGCASRLPMPHSFITNVTTKTRIVSPLLIILTFGAVSAQDYSERVTSFCLSMSKPPQQRTGNVNVSASCKTKAFLQLITQNTFQLFSS